MWLFLYHSSRGRSEYGLNVPHPSGLHYCHLPGVILTDKYDQSQMSQSLAKYMGIKKKIEAGGRVPADGQANTNLAANHNEQGFFFSGNLLIFHKMKYFI